MSSFCGIIIIYKCHHDIMWDNTPLSTRYSFIIGAYIIYDSWRIYQVLLTSLLLSLLDL